MLIEKGSHFIDKVDVTKRGTEDSHFCFETFGSESSIFDIFQHWKKILHITKCYLETKTTYSKYICLETDFGNNLKSSSVCAFNNFFKPGSAKSNTRND